MHVDDLGTGWTVVVPVKHRDRAKTRLSPALESFRSRLAHAFALDTVDVALGCDRVSRVVVVTDDDLLPADLPTGVEVVHDPAGGDDLDRAALAGCAVAPDGPVAVLAADLPALLVRELDEALMAASAHERALVVDADGTGTTVLAARRGDGLRPSYGAGSAARHVHLGAVALAGAWPGLRRDVDEPAHLELLRPHLTGRRTAALLASMS
ncbi:MAG: 2-phospho-L-lactate guanylyltransferase [Nocardioidaceae bacterium]|nr:2-phospho-L-lactate guanylyltransferase [Nocardioidaceae bacterium]